MIIAGTIPIEGLELIKGKPILKGNKIIINNKEFPISMGTCALIGAVLKTLEYFDENNIHVITAGDIGKGDGSLKIYDALKEVDDDLLIIHYIKPKISYIKEIDFSPKIIADAGGMYAAKAANIGDKFHLFLPDVGELAFLADEKASHPAYVRGFISEVDNKEVPELIRRAYGKSKMPKYMVVKGEKDYIVEDGNIAEIIDSPKIEAMECIGGTGDTLTGIISSLINCGYKTKDACVLGCKINRILGEISNVKPNTQINELIYNIPKVLKFILNKELF
ncbi:carbohydrate kinase-like protein [Methanocaldococcus villosus KIN24-T80]|uniref:Carbohydrate kinase-like protein n=1 Tax=Methanocaldococcus villosus KIN24-T80 TaxID=1069083 RepID=N6UW62_9EURY|nr:NAD(P)H-hydrate dehydratase [Methanocaldococcus villosus]ENN96554.1 carbohydrate kinase-like protein [Methanocaldococcus villosus KIN24-T80]